MLRPQLANFSIYCCNHAIHPLPNVLLNLFSRPSCIYLLPCLLTNIFPDPRKHLADRKLDLRRFVALRAEPSSLSSCCR